MSSQNFATKYFRRGKSLLLYFFINGIVHHQSIIFKIYSNNTAHHQNIVFKMYSTNDPKLLIPITLSVAVELGWPCKYEGQPGYAGFEPSPTQPLQSCVAFAFCHPLKVV